MRLYCIKGTGINRGNLWQLWIHSPGTLIPVPAPSKCKAVHCAGFAQCSYCPQSPAHTASDKWSHTARDGAEGGGRVGILESTAAVSTLNYCPERNTSELERPMQLANKHQLAKKDGKRKTESKHACPNAKSIPKRKLETKTKKKKKKKKKARPNALRNCNKSKSLSDLFLECVFFLTSFYATSLSLSVCLPLTALASHFGTY